MVTTPKPRATRPSMTVRLFGEHSFRVDEAVFLTPDPARAFHFGEDGERLRS